jgi:hypothetical protein
MKPSDCLQGAPVRMRARLPMLAFAAGACAAAFARAAVRRPAFWEVRPLRASIDEAGSHLPSALSCSARLATWTSTKCKLWRVQSHQCRAEQAQ